MSVNRPSFRRRLSKKPFHGASLQLTKAAAYWLLQMQKVDFLRNAYVKLNVVLVPFASWHECHDIPCVEVCTSLPGARLGASFEVNATCQSPLVETFSPAGKPFSIPPSESILGRSHHEQALLQRRQQTTKALLLSASHAYSDHALVYVTSHVD